MKIKNLPKRDQVYWHNVGLYYLIVLGAIFLLSNIPEHSFSLATGFFFVSIAAIVILGHQIGLQFSQSEKKEFV